MDNPDPEKSKIARDEGFLIRTRVNTELDISDERYEKNTNTGSQGKPQFYHRYNFEKSNFVWPWVRLCVASAESWSTV